MALLECALDLFSTRGYDAVGVQEIAEAAGVTKPTLYHYFGSKGGVLQTLLIETFHELDEQVQRAVEYHGDLTYCLTQVVQTYFQFARSHPSAYRLLLSLWFAPHENEAYQLSQEIHSRQYQMVEELFKKAVKQHGNMRGRHQLYAASLIGMIHTYIGLWLNNFVQLKDELVYQAVHQFEHGIYS